MGDGGLIAQITDVRTGKVVAVTNSGWRLKVIHRAPLNRECEKAPDPDAACRFERTEAPPGWASADFDDGSWSAATEWTAADVRPKDGYNKIKWDGAARLIWGSDLEVDNTILLRLTVRRRHRSSRTGAGPPMVPPSRRGDGPHPPAPSPTWGVALGPGPEMAGRVYPGPTKTYGPPATARGDVDCGLRRNDGADGRPLLQLLLWSASSG